MSARLSAQRGRLLVGMAPGCSAMDIMVMGERTTSFPYVFSG